jgi:pilus assembly protein CpaC
MNITNQNNRRQSSASGLSRISKPATQAIRLAAWAAMAGGLLSASAHAANTGACGPVAAVEATPATAPAPATQPAAEPAAAATNPAASASPATEPAVSLVSRGLGANGAINLMLNKSVVLTTRVPYARVHIAQPDIADVQLIQPAANQILVTGKKAGSTQLVIWDNQEHSQVIEVVIGFDLRGLDSQIKMMFPKAAITVESANGVIVLRGHVPDLETATKAVAVAEPYSTGGKTPVLNFMEVSGGQQVMLQVRFAEVSRSVTQKLGFNAFATDGKFSLGLGQGTAGSAPTVANAATIGTNNGANGIPIYGGAAFGNATFEYFVNALRSNNLLRTLAEPNLTAISGQPASFLAGGEFPIPIPQASGGGTAITIEYKKFGIQLNFTPTVLGDGRIRLLATPSVSELDFSNAVQLDGFTIPALTTRNVNTTVELAEGQTFALAGLLQNQIKASNNVTPLLGDLPILGPLFRSVSYERDETELVVLVTPRLVEALNPNQVPRIPGEVWRDPTEAELFWKGDLGGEAPNMQHAPHVRMSHFYGTPGFNPATAPQK